MFSPSKPRPLFGSQHRGGAGMLNGGMSQRAQFWMIVSAVVAVFLTVSVGLNIHLHMRGNYLTSRIHEAQQRAQDFSELAQKTRDERDWWQRHANAKDVDLRKAQDRVASQEHSVSVRDAEINRQKSENAELTGRLRGLESQLEHQVSTLTHEIDLYKNDVEILSSRVEDAERRAGTCRQQLEMARMEARKNEELWHTRYTNLREQLQATNVHAKVDSGIGGARPQQADVWPSDTDGMRINTDDAGASNRAFQNPSTKYSGSTDGTAQHISQQDRPAHISMGGTGQHITDTEPPQGGSGDTQAGTQPDLSVSSSTKYRQHIATDTGVVPDAASGTGSAQQQPNTAQAQQDTGLNMEYHEGMTERPDEQFNAANTQTPPPVHAEPAATDSTQQAQHIPEGSMPMEGSWGRDEPAENIPTAQHMPHIRVKSHLARMMGDQLGNPEPQHGRRLEQDGVGAHNADPHPHDCEDPDCTHEHHNHS